jgi:AcrR family transcriptional regulator
MPPVPPYAHLLKRAPTQSRSVQRVEGLLDAAADLLRDQEPEEVTIRDLAERAGVPTGTLYQFFDDKNAVLQALAVRFLAAMPDVLDAALEQTAADWPVTLDRVVEGYAAMVREHPAIRRLWLSGTLAASTRSLERTTDDALAARLGARLQEQAGSRHGTAAQWSTLVALVDGLLRHAFAVHPDGDPVTLEEARRAARAYAAEVLAPPSRSRPGRSPGREAPLRSRAAPDAGSCR